MKIYVYTEYEDDLSYAQRIVRVFKSRESGLAFLKQRVEKEFEMPWDEAEKCILEADPDAVFKEDYVTTVRPHISLSDETTNIFFILEPVEIQ